ncbi:MAG: SDR family oxidoreductase [Gammaproteobacteria bacterium]|nr:SDR family oxidoreductase [Gammaproteobacteria bacterium]
MTPVSFDLGGKTAIVTGGAGILGRGFCKVLAEHGASVAVVDVGQRAVEETAEELAAAGIPRERLLAQVCDVTDRDGCDAMVRSVVTRFGGVHILHNNAASKSDDLRAFFAPFEDYDLATWRKVSAVNVDGMFLVAQAVGRQMISQGQGGSIIHTSSIYGVVGPDQRIYEGSEYLGMPINTPAVYATTKAAVIGMARYLATYWARHGIRVNVLTPGGVESGQNDTFNRLYSARVPLGRMAQASELHGALLFLASDASSYVTGQNIIVDGGLTCW